MTPWSLSRSIAVKDGSAILLYRTADAAVRQLKPFFYLLAVFVDGKTLFYVRGYDGQRTMLDIRVKSLQSPNSEPVSICLDLADCI